MSVLSDCSTVAAAAAGEVYKKNRFFGAAVLLETVSSMPSSLRPGVLDYGQPLWESDDLGDGPTP